MASPRCSVMLLAVFHFVTLCCAGPLGPLPNMTSADMGFKEASCALGDVVYLPGDEFPGSDPCETCKCSNGGVQCEKQQCEARPGCKALHRPDHCCPTYQCECEQEGRVYGNGEKLVDPVDPCRVCYCQGGEVVCRRIACFVRDDCTPRLVPGRCCPEYDNCPVRGVTALPGISSLTPSLSPIVETQSSAAPYPQKDNIKQEFSIIEITPVSEIPVITDFKVKEILPSPSVEVAEYSSSKSPLIPREATSEKNLKNDTETAKTEIPTIIEVHPVLTFPDDKKTDDSQYKYIGDAPPSKISFSTQDSINSEIYPSNVPAVATMGFPSIIPDVPPVAITTKAPMMEEEDLSLDDHNPAFPPLPDDLSDLSNHGDEIVPESFSDSYHIPSHEIVIPSGPSAEPKIEELLTTHKDIIDTIVTTEKVPETSAGLSSTKLDSIISTESSNPKKTSMLNLRSAIPTDILNVPSYVSADITGELDENFTTEEPETVSTTLITKKLEENISVKKEYPIKNISKVSPPVSPNFEITTQRATLTSELESTHLSSPKANLATEVTSQTELSSLPIETSDQNPHESETISKDKSAASTSDPLKDSSKVPSTSSEVITVSRSVPNKNNMFENVETTEFILTSLGSSESTTDSEELIKISGDTEKSAPLIDAPERKKDNVLTDLINLVSDVASIDHTEAPDTEHMSGSTSISDSEELIPVNAGYKSKNSNWNQNSITEIPSKSKNTASGNKQNIVEIQDDDTDNITDSPAPNNKVEPTTRRPIIDNVSDNVTENKTEKKDIEIITQSYVPTINRRPTKVIMKKSNEKPDPELLEEPPVSVSAEVGTENYVSSSETANTAGADALLVEIRDGIEDMSNATLSTVL